MENTNLFQFNIFTRQKSQTMTSNKNIVLFILLTTLTLTTCTWVRTLQSDTELEILIQQNPKKVWLILRGKQTTDLLEDVAQTFRGMISVGFIQDDSDSNRVELIKDNLENPIFYKDELTVQKVVKFILNQLDEVIKARSEVAKAVKAQEQYQEKQAARAKKQWDDEQNLRKKSDTIILDAGNWNTFLSGRQAWIINFYEANCSACIDLNNAWESVSTAFKGKVKVAKINMTESQNQLLQNQVQLSKYPSIRFYSSGPKKIQQFTEYEGVRKPFTIQEWLNERTKQKAATLDIQRLSKQNFESLCKNTKNTCIIVFLENASDQISKKLNQLSEKHLKKPITFLVSEKGEQKDFAKQLEVISYPDTVMIYTKQKKMWRMNGLNFEAIDEAINEISMGNRNNFVKYPFAQPNLK